MFAFDALPVPTLCLPERHIIHIVLLDENIREPVEPASSLALPCRTGCRAPLPASPFRLPLFQIHLDSVTLLEYKT
jgi:hypothetical protein